MDFSLEIEGDVFTLYANGSWVATGRDFFNTIGHAACRGNKSNGHIVMHSWNLIDLQYLLFAQGWKRNVARESNFKALQRWYWRSPIGVAFSLMIVWDRLGTSRPIHIYFQTHHPRYA